MKYAINNSQQTLINLLRPQINQQFSNNNQNSIKYLLKNLKNNNIISHNNCYISKFKTTKNSPERFIIEKANNMQKNVDSTNNINYKKNSKLSAKGRLILNNQKKAEKIIEDILKNKIIKNKEKINSKIYENKNNSINQGTIYKNIKHNNNTNINDNLNLNINNISHILPNKNKYLNQNIIGFDFNNQISGPTLPGPNSYRVPQKRSNSILDDEEYFIYHNKNNKNINKKNIIDKKFFYSSNKPIQKTKNNDGSTFNTIIAKKNIYNQKQNNNNKINNDIIINNIKKNNYLQQNISKTNSIFSSTMSSLSKPKPQKQTSKNYNLEVKSKTAYPTKNNSRKQSNEKSIHKNNNTNNSSKNKYKNYSNINHMRVYSDKNKYINKNKTPIVTKNNKKLDSNNNYKINSINNSNNSNQKCINNSNINSNIVQIIPNGLNNSQYKLSNINSTNNSKEYSHENSSKQNKINNTNIIDLKKSTVDKILNHIHKNKDKNNINKEDYLLKEKITNLINKNIYSNISNINYKDFKINNKILVNKNINPIIVKEEKIVDNNSNSNSKNEIKKKNNTNKEKKNDGKTDSEIKSGKKDLLFAYNLNNKKKEEKTDQSKKNDNINNSTKKFPDKDLSDSENDSLLLYVNNNIENDNHQDSILNESSSSIISTLKENGKFSCYNRDMEIISTYIKSYYEKNDKYPKTKMNFYKYGRLLGKGAFGKVNLALHVLTGRLVAIKSINKTKLLNERQKRKMLIETSIMKTLSKSNNIVKIYETYETKKHYCIVMEYICAGDLLSYIKKRGKLTEQVAKFIFKQIVLTLQYIHDHNIVHRDIKLDNILIDLDNNIKICDFGVSKIIKNNESMIEQCGTPAYIAPEILLNRGYEGFGVDIWSSGVVLYAMLSGTVPFKGNNIKDLHDLIIKGEYTPIKDISKEATHLIKNIFEVDPKKRITTKDILVHPWLIDVDLNYWKNQNLFTNAEYILLAKSNVDYRDISNKDDMIEIFDIKNLDTNDESQNKNVKTKSFILAPFNSSIEDDEEDNYNFNSYEESLDCNNTDLKIQNGLIKFNNKVKDLNRNYELNNNQEIDNGVVISPNNSDEKNNKKDNDISPYNGSFNSKGNSKPFSPRTELEEPISNSNRNKVNFDNKEDEINDKALDDLKVLGYKKSFVKESLIKNNFNYATASYKLIVKYCYS